ncbi:MAG: lysozyme inhibitor LprI family protein [Pseudomonadota bacterium]
MTSHRFVLLIALALSSATALADAKSESGCDNQATADARDCYVAQNERTEKQLKLVVAKKIRALKYNASFKEEGWSMAEVIALNQAFSRSQNQWEKYRDYWCEYQARSIKGSGADSSALSCFSQLTNQRIAEIGE